MEKKRLDLRIVEPWLEVKIGIDNRIVEFGRFLSNIESLGSVHVRRKWLPAACTGLELWLIVKWGLGALGSIWLSGKVYDVMKVYENRLLKYLESLFSANHEDMTLNTLDIDYDDTTITFHSITGRHLSGLSSFFNNLQKHFKILESKGIQNISKISFPIYGDEVENAIKVDDSLKNYDSWEQDYFRIWSITYDFGLSRILYDSASEILLK